MDGMREDPRMHSSPPIGGWSGIRSRGARFALAVLPVALVLAVACSSSEAPVADEAALAAPTDETAGDGYVAAVAIEPEAPVGPEASSEREARTQTEPPMQADASVATALPAAAPGSPPTYLTFNQAIIEGLGSEGIQLNDPTSVFGHVFARLPDEVVVYPSENYYYFILQVEGRQVWGNIRLPAGQREEGILSFGYFEFIEFPTTTPTGIRGSQFYDADDGVDVREVDPFTYTVAYEGKEVVFRFHQLDQSQPGDLALAPGERFIQRTFDESGYQFYLLFDEQSDHFLWVLNEEQTVPDLLEAQGENLLIGRRSGFAFWVDPMGRKVLAGVRQLNIRRNDYFDGPFDQLADNYAEETHISAWMQRAYPSLQGRIDAFGYYTDQERPVRVAISTYYTYAATSHMVAFVKLLANQDDAYAFISRGGRPRAGSTGASAN